MHDEYRVRTDCRMCGSLELELELSLAALPIGDRYVPEAQKNLTTKIYPLNVMRCKRCGQYQNSGYIQPDLIYQNYLSRPATTNPVLSDAYKEYADHLLKIQEAEGEVFSVETGSNDGAFSKYMKERGARILCIEPAPNLVEQANQQGIPTLRDYFSLDLAKKIRSEHGAADFLIGNHMFSNVNNSKDFIEGVKHLLKPNGIFAMQTFYHLDVIEKNLIENFTHEHLSYFYVKSFSTICQLHNMEIFDVKRLPAKGGAIRCFVQHKGGPKRIEPSVAEIISFEEGLKMGSRDRHQSVEAFIKRTKRAFFELLIPEIQRGGKIAGFGTSTGATTFSYNFGLGELISFLVDDDPYRHNLVSPGYHIPVLPSQAIYDQKPSHVIVLAPLYADAIMGKNKRYLEQGGVFVKFWPEFEVIKA
jgi:2-polyprenyl-3-methyl-5-hydroxy-6-metoxy-1,4-benzoquinol methylase